MTAFSAVIAALPKIHKILRHKLLITLILISITPSLVPPLSGQENTSPPDKNTSTAAENTTSSPPSYRNNYEKTAQKSKSIYFINDINLLFYFHHNQGVEITGNEGTFTTAFNLAFASIRNLSPAWQIGFTSDLYVIENLSLKGRLFDNFNPPPFLLRELLVDIIYQNGNIPFETKLALGVFRPLAKTFPMRNYHLPIVFRTSPYNPTKGALDPLDTAEVSAQDLRTREVGHALITGYRDDPLGAVILDNFDTGLLYTLYAYGFEFGFSVSNGEEGLDANSAKALATRLAFKSNQFHTGFNTQIGNIGSVPIKETKNFFQHFFYYTSTHFNCNLFAIRTYARKCPAEKNWHNNRTENTTPPPTKPAPVQFQLGFETMLHLHGIRNLDIINPDGTLNPNFTWLGNPLGQYTVTNISTNADGTITTNVINRTRTLGEFFNYIDGYFSPFAVFNDGSYNDSAQINPETLYGLSFLIFSELRYKDFLSFVVHFSGYDPNLLSEGNELYTLRYRAFSRLGFHIKNFLDFYISFTYTHDALHLNWAQFFEREPRSLHFIRDYSFYLGLVYYIGR
ncbi:hypothetical protein COTS27_01260 [Spirochaetota bacterium]|nr:hypothetical protein COTS27_01260 [Spirochaetota bacterium]